ncbi:hypothetical protein J5U23_00482 [Saccharolobus shibatae B12]|uniref:Uncharacterized protein n=1 Tax=Saccharolobus shibatae (strain ATCC 51178 / DSM 5389 / JCM 8931 / NBRC 15437 / B12) TaxID=523848 RepID=A0A8F5GSA8_SACSH|nr:hypothetical protein J5U23_00482 [Saccharolobus shibatae B12]
MEMIVAPPSVSLNPRSSWRGGSSTPLRKIPPKRYLNFIRGLSIPASERRGFTPP